MISGLNQEVEILGRTFHVQTELSRRGELSIRTEVFLGGKIVATRERKISRADWQAGDEMLRHLMKDQHHKILANVVERARRYQERQGRSELAMEPVPIEPETTAEVAALVAEPEPDMAPPPAQIRAEVSGAIGVRRTFGELRQRFDIAPLKADEDIVPRLERASLGIAWIAASPSFSEIRIDEQLRFNLVREQLDDWEAGGKEPEQARRLWTEIVTFNDYLTEVNHRAELVDFDRHLLVWAIHRIQRDGLTEQILGYLGLVYGRDAKLDQLIESPSAGTTDYWIALLRRVLSLIDVDART